MADRRPTLLVLRHAAWENPHRILGACGSLQVRVVEPLAGEPLPDHAEVAGVVAMGGPMNVDATDRHPALALEREWLAEALRGDLPVLGVCLGAQLLARALGAEVRPGEGPEIGFLPVEVLDPTDPLIGCLAPTAGVLHWHRDVFELPDGARALARSEATECQAFRFGRAWGVLFHPEADVALIRAWLAVPEMAREAELALGVGAAETLLSDAAAAEPELSKRSTPGFRAFAGLLESAQ